MRSYLVICLDGTSPDYLVHASLPTFDELGPRGWRTAGQSPIPAVTNVNDVSVITGGPARHHSQLLLKSGRRPGHLHGSR